MVDKDVLKAKLSAMAHRIDRVRAHAGSSEAALAADEDALDLVAFNLMLAVQNAADIASHVIADEGWTGAANLADSFARLHAQGVLTSTTAEALARAAGLRNVVAHAYHGVDVAKVFAAATAGVADLEAFAAEVAEWLQMHA